MDTLPLSAILPIRQLKPPTYPVVYFLFKGEVLVYIGHTKDLLTRIYQHARNHVDFDTYATVDASGLSHWQRRDLETAYIRALQPTLNAQSTGKPTGRKRARPFTPQPDRARELWELMNPKALSVLIPRRYDVWNQWDAFFRASNAI